MRESELKRRHPQLYHVAEAGAWPAIRRHGLLSTSALLEHFEVDHADRRVIESQRRAQAVTLRHPEHGIAIVRDNKPVRPEVLEKCLEGISVAEWFQTLNRRVFFWVDRERVRRLVGARAHRGRVHDVLVVDARALIARHASKVTVTSINSGAAMFPRAPKRGRSTFRALHEHDPAVGIVELTVEHAVPDIEAVTIRVEQWQAGSRRAVVWRR